MKSSSHEIQQPQATGGSMLLEALLQIAGQKTGDTGLCALRDLCVRPKGARSGQERFDDFPVHIGKAEIAALEAIGQPGMVQPEQMQDRGVEIVDVNLLLDGVETELVGLAI